MGEEKDIDKCVTEECTPVGFVYWNDGPSVMIKGVPHWTGIEKAANGWLVVAAPFGPNSSKEEKIYYTGIDENENPTPRIPT